MFRNRCNSSVTQTDHDGLVGFTAAVSQSEQYRLYQDKCLKLSQNNLRSQNDSRQFSVNEPGRKAI
jgi:hypothetical protein